MLLLLLLMNSSTVIKMTSVVSVISQINIMLNGNRRTEESVLQLPCHYDNLILPEMKPQ